MVQRKAVRWMESRSKPYINNKIVKALKLQNLQTRRKIARLKLMHEIINGTKVVNEKSIPQLQRCKDLRFKPIHGSINSYTNSYFPHTIKAWNRLPALTVNTTHQRTRLILFFNIENYYISAQ